MKSSKPIGFVLVVIGVFLVLLGALCPCLRLAGEIIVFAMGATFSLTGVAMLASWPLLERVIDKLLKVFERLWRQLAPRQ